MSTTSTSTVQEVLEMSTTKKQHFLPSSIGTDTSFQGKIVWKNVIGFVVLHSGALYGFYLGLTAAKWTTVVFSIFMVICTGEGITAGAHRLFSHKSFKAKMPLKLALLTLQTMAGQNCMYIWVRDHRQHHKFSDTDADPHNANRGFFFSHMGWLMVKKHPMVIEKGKTIDMSDMESDFWVMFQKRHYYLLYLILAVAIPVAIPVYFWGETLKNSIFISYFFRYVTLLHITWTVNSIAHFYGTKPFDKNIVPVESMCVAAWSFGEGYHNYHHTFPWDYKASEFGTTFNVTCFLIDVMALIGQAYDLREPSFNMIQQRIKRTGDGTHRVYGGKELKDEADYHAEKFELIENNNSISRNVGSIDDELCSRG